MVVIHIMIRHTLILKFADRGTFGVESEVKIKIKIIQYVYICHMNAIEGEKQESSA